MSSTSSSYDESEEQREVNLLDELDNLLTRTIKVEGVILAEIKIRDVISREKILLESREDKSVTDTHVKIIETGSVEDMASHHLTTKLYAELIRNERKPLLLKHILSQHRDRENRIEMALVAASRCKDRKFFIRILEDADRSYKEVKFWLDFFEGEIEDEEAASNNILLNIDAEILYNFGFAGVMFLVMEKHEGFCCEILLRNLLTLAIRDGKASLCSHLCKFSSEPRELVAFAVTNGAGCRTMELMINNI